MLEMEQHALGWVLGYMAKFDLTWLEKGALVCVHLGVVPQALECRLNRRAHNYTEIGDQKSKQSNN